MNLEVGQNKKEKKENHCSVNKSEKYLYAKCKVIFDPTLDPETHK